MDITSSAAKRASEATNVLPHPYRGIAACETKLAYMMSHVSRGNNLTKNVEAKGQLVGMTNKKNTKGVKAEAGKKPVAKAVKKNEKDSLAERLERLKRRQQQLPKIVVAKSIDELHIGQLFASES